MAVAGEPLSDEEAAELLLAPVAHPPTHTAIAYARIEIRNFTRQLYVPDCPFCHRSHRHGAGVMSEPITEYLCVHESACAPPDYKPQRYLLRVAGVGSAS